MNNTVAIIACLKTEERYIKEWLDWHIKIGIDHFYLCDNNDSDYPIKLCDVIKEYIDKGIVEVFNYNDIHPIQPHCYNDIYQKYGNLYDWYLIIDIDEFLVIPKTNDDLKKFINTFPKYVDNIIFNWRYYGDNGLIEDDGRGCLERFIEPVNIEGKIINGKSNKFKSMIRNKQYFIDNYKDFNLKINNQHIIFNNSDILKYNICNIVKNINIKKLKYKLLKKYDVLFNNIKWHINYKPFFINGSFSQDNKDYEELFKNIYNTCYLKHFMTKTIDEYIKYKINRGDTLKRKDDEKYPYSIGKFFGINEKTDVHRKFIANISNK